MIIPIIRSSILTTSPTLKGLFIFSEIMIPRQESEKVHAIPNTFFYQL